MIFNCAIFNFDVEYTVSNAKTKTSKRAILDGIILAMQSYLAILLRQYTACSVHIYPADLEDKTDISLQGPRQLEWDIVFVGPMIFFAEKSNS